MDPSINPESITREPVPYDLVSIEEGLSFFFRTKFRLGIGHLVLRHHLRKHRLSHSFVAASALFTGAMVGITYPLAHIEDGTTDLAPDATLLNNAVQDGFSPVNLRATGSNRLSFTQVEPTCVISLSANIVPMVASAGTIIPERISRYQLVVGDQTAPNYNFGNLRDMQLQLGPDVCATFQSLQAAAKSQPSS